MQRDPLIKGHPNNPNHISKASQTETSLFISLHKDELLGTLRLEQQTWRGKWI